MATTLYCLGEERSVQMHDAPTVVSPNSWGDVYSFEKVTPNPEKYLYVWAAPENKNESDFIAVIDIDKYSANYGKIIKTTPIESTGNGPHHIAINNSKTVLAAAGLISGKIFFFDISKNPTQPKLFLTYRSVWKKLGNPAMIKALPKGGFLVAMMGSNNNSSGNFLQFNDRGKQIRIGDISNGDAAINIDNFDYSVNDNIVISSDLTSPDALMNGKLDSRNTVRLWDYKYLTLHTTVKVGNGPSMVKLIPGTYKAYASCLTDGSLWIINLHHPRNTKKIMEYDPYVGKNTVMPTQMYITRNGKRLIQSMYGQSKVTEYAIDNPEHPNKIAEVAAGQGPHFLAVTKDEKRLFVSYNFMEAGKTVLKGDNHVRLINMDGKGIFLDPTFDVDFSSTPTGPARPSGTALF